MTIYDENVKQCEADWSVVKVSNIILPLHIGKDLVNLLLESSSKKTCQRFLIMVSFFSILGYSNFSTGNAKVYGNLTNL